MLKKITKPGATWLALIVGLSLILPTFAASKDDKKEKDAAPKVVMTAEEKDTKVDLIAKAKFKDADTCVSCHDAENEYPVFPLFKTKHAVKADSRTPMANEQCESCHGAGTLHTKAKKNDKRGGNIINFGKNVWTPVKDQNEKCLACHKTHQRIEWKGSSHEFAEVACASCHSIHTERDPILNKQTQQQVCFTCHTKERAKFLQPSHHPVREGRLACTDCHNVHGEQGSGAQIKASQREKCTSCHAEKRGPFLWEHAPAAEDCMLCHSPHGSNQAALLKKRAPFLCQECHSAAHASNQFDGSALNPLGARAFLGVKGCANCHSQVHGSNHPSGAAMFR